MTLCLWGIRANRTAPSRCQNIGDLPTGEVSDWHIRHSTFQSPTSSSYQNLTHSQALSEIIGIVIPSQTEGLHVDLHHSSLEEPNKRPICQLSLVLIPWAGTPHDLRGSYRSPYPVYPASLIHRRRPLMGVTLNQWFAFNLRCFRYPFLLLTNHKYILTNFPKMSSVVYFLSKRRVWLPTPTFLPAPSTVRLLDEI